MRNLNKKEKNGTRKNKENRVKIIVTQEKPAILLNRSRRKACNTPK
jgi:hypothetical protein